jgi:hypothetical protein
MLWKFSPDSSGKPREKKLFFLELEERPEEAPSSTLEKTAFFLELEANGWNSF